MAIQVSVVIPTHNRATLIGATLRSILRQSHPPSEVIVVDDGSTDDTEAAVADLGSAVKYLRIQNSGRCRARNVGVLASSAPWIAFCDSDDLWLPEKLELQCRLFDACPDSAYGFTNFRTVQDDVWSDETKFDSSPLGFWDAAKREVTDGAFVITTSMFERLLRHQPVFPSSVMMKRELFDRIGGWNDSLGRTLSEDLEFTLRCVDHPPLGVVSAPVVGIRKHGGNVSGNSLATTIGEIAILRHVLEHNSAARRRREAIEAQIIARSATAAQEAFAQGDFALTRQLLKAVPPRQRSLRLWCKNVIALCPPPLDRAAQWTATHAGRFVGHSHAPAALP